MTDFSFKRARLGALIALAFAASAGAALAQSQPPCKSEDPADFDYEVRLSNCRDTATIYEYDYEAHRENPNAPAVSTPRTVVVTPHHEDYSNFRMSSMRQFYNGLNYEERQRVVQIAAQHGFTGGDDQPLSVEEFGSLTEFIDRRMDDGGFSQSDKQAFLGELAAKAHVYGNLRRDPTAGQDFGDGGPRYDYSYQDAPKR